jgi:hypothetical protein
MFGLVWKIIGNQGLPTIEKTLSNRILQGRGHGKTVPDEAEMGKISELTGEYAS